MAFNTTHNPAKESLALFRAQPLEKSRQILIADSDNDIQNFLSDILLKTGDEPVSATNWAEALNLFTHSEFDLVFADSKMICADGFSLAYHIKARSPETAVVLLVGQSKESLPENQEGGFFDDLLFKPFGSTDIQYTLKKFTETATLTDFTEKRSCKRNRYEAAVRSTLFNTGTWIKAQTLNHCPEGMCIKSNVLFRPGTTLLIRLEHRPSKTSDTRNSEGLPTIILADVKWCREISDTSFASYEAGVKYYAPHY
ncbi:MAG: response regulator [Proteobacteria bacterium]|nr:response regulator [Pseudomonadota bacterium]